MRILYISEVNPWPQTSGNKRRMASQLQILSQIGVVTLLTYSRGEGVPPEIEVLRYDRVRHRASFEKAWSWFCNPSLPRGVFPAGRSLRWLLNAALSNPFDVVWIYRIELWAGLRRWLPAGVPLIIDADDLVLEIMEGLADVPGTPRHTALLRALYIHEEIRRHKSLLHSGLRAGAVTFSNPVHVERFKHTGAVWVRNAVAPLGNVSTRRFEHPTRVVGFVGNLPYGPNADAAMRLAGGLGDRLRAAVPGTRVRAIGQVGDDLRHKLERAGIEVTGHVEDLCQALAELDAMVMPIMSGSGTRIKAIDAMSVGLPIISTSFGVDGLGLRDGHSVLLGETDADIARAWATLAGDSEYARQLAGNAYQHYRETLSLEALGADIEDALAVARGEAPTGKRPAGGPHTRGEWTPS